MNTIMYLFVVLAIVLFAISMGPIMILLLVVLGIPLAISAFEAAKPEHDDEEWSDQELQAGFWYRFLVKEATVILGLVGFLVIVLGVLGGGIYWIGAGVVFIVLVLSLRIFVFPALLARSMGGSDDHAG